MNLTMTFANSLAIKRSTFICILLRDFIKPDRM